MRLGTRVGPAYVSTSSRGGCGTVVGFFLAVLIPVGLLVTYPLVAIPVLAVIVASVAWLIARGRRPRPVTRRPGSDRVTELRAEITTLRQLHEQGRISDETFVGEVDTLQRAIDAEFGADP